VGALFFGWLTDRFGRRKLFMITLGVYLAATALTASGVPLQRDHVRVRPDPDRLLPR